MSKFEYTHMKGLESDALDLVAYNENTEQLLVRFINGGRDYVYEDVPFDVYDGFGYNYSERGYWSDNISGGYTNTRLDDNASLVFVAPAPVVNDVTAAEDVTAKFVEANDSDESSLTYGVKWTNDASLTFEPIYQATSETNAIEQWQVALAQAQALFGNDYTYGARIVSVTHYFE